MNKLFILCGMVFLGITSTPQSPEAFETDAFQLYTPVSLKATMEHEPKEQSPLFYLDCIESTSSEELDVSSIVYEEIEEPVVLGFDPREYLPENFNPYVTYIDFNAITYIEENKEELFQATLTALLPVGFNAYAAPADFMSISYMEEEEVDLGFDTTEWLPEGFDPYSRDLDLNTIVYIEEEDLDLGFDTSHYLPEDFDPFSL